MVRAPRSIKPQSSCYGKTLSKKDTLVKIFRRALINHFSLSDYADFKEASGTLFKAVNFSKCTPPF
jgi:hypothetical protein